MANKKFTDLLPVDAAPNLVGTDILAVTVDPNGTPVSNKTTITNLMALAPVQQSDITPLATQVSLGNAESSLTALINLRATQVSLGNHESLTQAHGISAFGATLVDDADNAAARVTLGVDAAGTDNSTDVTLDTTNHDYLNLTGQTVSLGAIDLSTDVTGLLPNTSVSGLGTAATTASTDYATAAQGTTADSAVQPTDGIEALSNVSISNPTDGSILKYVSANSQYEESTDYATAAQGTTADSATQPGDNVSTLTNDSGYITGVTAGELGDFDFDDNAIKGFSAEVPTEKTADHTLTNDDNGTVVVMNSASAIKVIVPSGLATGFNCSVIQKGGGQVEFDNNSGASTINNRQSHTKINGQYGVASIVAYATDTYILAGDTAS